MPNRTGDWSRHGKNDDNFSSSRESYGPHGGWLVAKSGVHQLIDGKLTFHDFD